MIFTRRTAAVALLALAIGCGGEGTAGPAGPQGAQGPPGPQGPPGLANAVTFSGQATISSINLVLPASVTSTNLPIFTCYISDLNTGPWIVVPFSTASNAPFCAVFPRADGVVEIRLRNWLVGYYYYVAAAWK